MATVETKREQTASADESVFVAQDRRRARRLRNAAAVAGVLAILWVVGLGVGMLGIGSLPGVALVRGAERHSQPQLHKPVSSLSAERKASQLLAAHVASVRRAFTSEAADRRVMSVAAARQTVARKAAHRPVAKAPAPAAQAQASVNPAQHTRGWSRKGYPAPRGQIRKAALTPPPATSRGRSVGRQTAVVTPAPKLAPGQAKKAAQPPPPPPPPPPSKKG